MSKILINNTGSLVNIEDTGVSIVANGNYIIPPNDYSLWAASSNVLTLLSNNTIKLNDGSSDLGLSDAIDLIKGIFPRHIIGGTTNARIGNVTDRLKVYDADLIATLTTLTGNVFKFNEANVVNRLEVDLANTTYTVPAGKQFRIANFSASYDAQAAIHVRLKKQTGGTGAWVTIYRLNVMSGGQGNSTLSLALGTGSIIGAAGDVFKVTYESSLSKGSLWASFGGSEF